MLHLCLEEILAEQGHSKYWLYKKLEPMSYQNFNRIFNNETSSIKFETLEKIHDALNVPYDRLFTQTDDNK